MPNVRNMLHDKRLQMRQIFNPQLIVSSHQSNTKARSRFMADMAVLSP